MSCSSSCRSLGGSVSSTASVSDNRCISNMVRWRMYSLKIDQYLAASAYGHIGWRNKFYFDAMLMYKKIQTHHDADASVMASYKNTLEYVIALLQFPYTITIVSAIFSNYKLNERMRGVIYHSASDLAKEPMPADAPILLVNAQTLLIDFINADDKIKYIDEVKNYVDELNTIALQDYDDAVDRYDDAARFNRF